MKVAHVTSSLSRRGSGVKVVVEAVSAAQAQQGADVHVFGMTDEDWIEQDHERWTGAPSSALPVVGPSAFGYMPGLLQAIHDFNPDVVHLHGLWTYSGCAVLRWQRAVRKPFMLSVHGMLSSVALEYGRCKKAAAHLLYQREIFAGASTLHATHPGEFDEIRAFGLKNEIALIPNGVHVNPLPTNLSPEPKKRLLSLGRIHPKKGLDRLVEAWQTLEPEFPDWSLDIVGPDECGHSKVLRRLINRFGLRNVSIRPAITGMDRDICMASAKLFVLPTRSENFALTVAESLMMAVPVISTTGAPWSGLVDNKCGWWIEQGVDPLVCALRRAMQLDDEARVEMGRNGRDWMIAEFGWPALAARYFTSYLQMVAAAPEGGDIQPRSESLA